jgi:hypothetical protein
MNLFIYLFIFQISPQMLWFFIKGKKLSPHEGKECKLKRLVQSVRVFPSFAQILDNLFSKS